MSYTRRLSALLEGEGREYDQEYLDALVFDKIRDTYDAWARGKVGVAEPALTAASIGAWVCRQKGALKGIGAGGFSMPKVMGLVAVAVENLWKANRVMKKEESKHSKTLKYRPVRAWWKRNRKRVEAVVDG